MAVLSFLLFLCIIQFFEFGHCLPCFENERNALVEFKHSVSDPLNKLSSWVGEHCCSWDGVGCDARTGHIVKLDLGNSGLVGEELIPSLIELKQLRYLHLSGNSFSGSRIPRFIGSFRHLRYLNLSETDFTGKVPHDLGNLSSLHSFHLSSYGDMWVDSLDWMSRLHSLQYLSMSGVNLSLPSDWQYTINQLPSLLELHLPYCGLPSFSYFNVTHLTVLDLSYNGFEGEIPSCLRNITSLEVLDLSYNNFQGEIPSCLRNLTSLEVLHLSANQLVSSIPSWLGNFHNLVDLSLVSNQFTGGIDWVGQLQSLKYLDLSGNSFAGPIPKSIGSLSALRELHLYRNHLNGTIPKDIGKLSKLRILDVRHNSLEGFVSEDHFAKLSRLEQMYMGYNSALVLNVGSRWIPPFQLKLLDMESLKVGPNFPTWLQTQTELTQLCMSNSSISTSIPDSFANQTFTHLELLDLSHNQIHGQVPTFLSPELEVLYLSFNKFESHFPRFPSNLDWLDLRNNSISGPLPNDLGDMMPLLSALILSSNHINGSIPNSICRMKDLIILDIPKNQLSGDLPLCSAGLQNLQAINLASNNLSGTIPSMIGHLQWLGSLRLSDNNFHGEIPLFLRNNTRLYLLDVGENKLSGNIPSWIGEDLTSLQFLRLRSNMFDGNIPSQLCHLTSLQIMDLAQNNLSGSIPHCVGNISAMGLGQTRGLLFNTSHNDVVVETLKGREYEYEEILDMLVNFDVSSNKLSGCIPKELTKLSGLIGLNLSNNPLTGSIPDNVCNFSLLESLDLSNNNLSGRIPQSLSLITSLNHLNLSHNLLSGPIPTGNQLQTLNDPSMYEGNVGLCGDPLQECKREDDSGGNVKAKDDKDDPELPGLYIGMVFGFIVGFWGLGCVYWFNKPWRYAYLRFIDRVIDMVFVTVVVRVNRLKRKIGRNQEVET